MDNATDSRWDWITCNYNLKSEQKTKQVIWNLSPSIILTNPQADGPDPNVKLFIDTEKSLEYSHELGWSWHKSWNLPNISVRLEIRDPRTGELLLAPKNLYAQIFAVKAVLDHSDNFHLVDVGIRGNSKIELVDGHAFFTALKFSSTSYNNEGVKFHLVLSLYIMGEEDVIPKILNSTISPPIFVDSRKQARDTNVLLEKKMSSFVEPFPSETIEKMFIKRENKRKNDIEIQILNDFEGLFNYLTAPNIRHKVKHPLFLAIKFSSCVKLYYNKDLIQDQSIGNIVQLLQKRIYEDHQYKKQGSPSQKLKEKLFILVIKETTDTFKNKKIIEAVEPLQCQSLGILYSISQQIPNCFQELNETTELFNMYKKTYANLFSNSKINKSFIDGDGDDKNLSDSDSEGDDDDQDDDDDDDDDAQDDESRSESEKKTKKKVKANNEIKDLLGESNVKPKESAKLASGKDTTTAAATTAANTALEPAKQADKGKVQNVQTPAAIKNPTQDTTTKQPEDQQPNDTEKQKKANQQQLQASGSGNFKKFQSPMPKDESTNQSQQPNQIQQQPQQPQAFAQGQANGAAGTDAATLLQQQLLAGNLLTTGGQNNQINQILKNQQLLEQLQKNLQQPTQGATNTGSDQNINNSTNANNATQNAQNPANSMSSLLSGLNYNQLLQQNLQPQASTLLNSLQLGNLNAANLAGLAGANAQNPQQNNILMQLMLQQQQQQKAQPGAGLGNLLQSQLLNQNGAAAGGAVNPQQMLLNNLNLQNSQLVQQVQQNKNQTQGNLDNLLSLFQQGNQAQGAQNTTNQQNQQNLRNLLNMQPNLQNQLKNPLQNLGLNNTTGQLNINSLLGNLGQGTNTVASNNNLMNLVGNNMGLNNMLKQQGFGQNSQNLGNLQNIQSLLSSMGQQGLGQGFNFGALGANNLLNINEKQEHNDINDLKRENEK